MGRIARLDPLVAERIAAGEVIERPASIVKELIENSLDAGATRVVVRLEEGGKRLIEITDNGSGMDTDDLMLCWERHATSKVRSMEDLETLSTLGFRGEALPSVAAVAELEILSRADATQAVYKISPGMPAPTAETFGTFLDSPTGTRIQVRELFGAIPVRHKFLRSQTTETSAIRDLMERLALARPDVQFSLETVEKGIVFQTHASTDTARVIEILGSGKDYPVRTESRVTPWGNIEIYWISGLSLGRSTQMVQVLNGRILKDRLLQHCLSSAFKQSLLPGQFPALLVKLEVRPDFLDVNVHPTKQEVKFLDPSSILSELHRALTNMLGRSSVTSWVASNDHSPVTLTPEQSHVRARELLPFTPAFSMFQQSSTNAHATDSHVEELLAPPHPPQAEPDLSRHFFLHARRVGIVFQTYLILENQGELVLVDQHAAHERIRFEALRNAHRDPNRDLPSQGLLKPEVFRLRALAPANAVEKLERLSVDAEVFGAESILIRSVPSLWGNEDLAIRLQSLIDRLENSTQQPNRDWLEDETLFERLASRACRSSKRAGDSLNELEQIALLNELAGCEHPWNCPHGRPVFVRMPEARLEEWFQRAAPR